LPGWTTLFLENEPTVRVGDRVRLVDARLDPHFKDRPNGWMVVFEANGGEQYAAAQTYFVTEECWSGIEQYFIASVANRR